MRGIALMLLLSVVVGCAREEAPAVLRRRPRKPPKLDPAKVVGTEVGNLMPAYDTKALDGSTIDLTALRGRVVVVNVWATWCVPCRAETPTLVAIQNQYGGRGLKVIGVSVDEGGVEGVKEFVDTQKVNYTIGLDPEGRIANVIQTTVLPTTLVLDRTGHVVWREAGMISAGDASLTKAIEAALPK